MTTHYQIRDGEGRRRGMFDSMTAASLWAIDKGLAPFSVVLVDDPSVADPNECESPAHPCICGGSLECRDDSCDMTITVNGCQSCMGVEYRDDKHGGAA